MVQTNYFVEIRRRALEIDWRVPISVYNESNLDETAPNDLLLGGRYLRIDRDLLVVAPRDRGMLFHRYFDPDVKFAGSPLKLKAGQSIPVSWVAMMTAAPLFALKSEQPSSLTAIAAPGCAIETIDSDANLTLGSDYRVSVGPETRLWLTEGGRGKPWTIRLLRGSIYCEAVMDRPSPLRVETLRGQGKLFGGAFGVEMFAPRGIDVAVATSIGGSGPTRWEMGGFGYSLSGGKPALAWMQSSGGPDGVDFDSLSGRLSPHLGAFVERAIGRQPGWAVQPVAKVNRASPAEKTKTLPAKSGAGPVAAQRKSAQGGNVGAAAIAPLPKGHAPEIAPIAMLDKPLHTIEQFNGDIELRLSVDQGALFCRRNDLAQVDGSGTGAVLLRGPLAQVNVALSAVTYEPAPQNFAKPGASPSERRVVMVTVYAHIGGRVFESNLPLEQLLTTGGSAPAR